jgi:uncharacterized alpha-E superfamily protein
VHIVAPAVAVERTGSRLPSRAADNFYWLGRYAERLEHLARVSRCVIGRLNEEMGAAETSRLAALHRLLAQLALIPFGQPADLRADTERELISILHDPGRSPGVRQLLQKIHLSAFAVRDRLSADTWRILGRLEPDARFRGGQLPLVHASSVLHTLVLDLAAFSGMEMENMTRGHGWTFLDIGRRLERASGLLRLLGTALRSGDDLDELLEPVLEIADSVMTHRRRYFSDLRPHTVLELLLADDGNPRSLAFQFARLVKHSTKLPNASNPAGVLQLREKIAALADAASRTAYFHTDDWQELAWVLHGFDVRIGEVSELMTQVLFSHVVAQVS